MRATEILLIIIVSFLFFIGHPGKRMQRQEQQATGEQDILEISYRVTDSTQENVADINWMKKAAQTAVDEGRPYFNILKQKVTRSYSKENEAYLTTIVGSIQLTDDSIEADYNAYEIVGLNLGD